MGVIVLDAGNGRAAGFDTFFTGDFAVLFWTLFAFADVDFAGSDRLRRGHGSDRIIHAGFWEGF